MPLNRWIPEWIASLAFRGDNSVRTIFLGSEKSARRLENWASRQPLYGIDIIGVITYEMATDLKLKMPILGEFMDMSLIVEAYKVDQVVLLETRNSDWWVDSVIEERVRYDLKYIRNWSFWLDLWILIKTVLQVIKPPKTAY